MRHSRCTRDMIARMRSGSVGRRREVSQDRERAEAIRTTQRLEGAEGKVGEDGESVKQSVFTQIEGNANVGHMRAFGCGEKRLAFLSAQSRPAKSKPPFSALPRGRLQRRPRFVSFAVRRRWSFDYLLAACWPRCDNVGLLV